MGPASTKSQVQNSIKQFARLYLFLFYLPHQFFRLFVGTCHDVGDTQIGQHNRTHAQYIIVVLLYHRLVESYCFLVLVLLKMEGRSNYQKTHSKCLHGVCYLFGQVNERRNGLFNHIAEFSAPYPE